MTSPRIGRRASLGLLALGATSPLLARAAQNRSDPHAGYWQSPPTTLFGYEERLSYPADIAAVCHIVVFYGQSENIGQKSAAEPLIATRPVFPGKALMFEGGPWIDRASDSIVDLVEHEHGSIPGGQGETKASSAVNHLIRDFKAVTGSAPIVLAIVGGEGGETLSMLGHGSPPLERTMAAVRTASSWARAQGLRPVVLAFDLEQGQSDEIDQGTSSYRNAKGDAPRRIAELRRFGRTATERLVQITGQWETPLLLLHQVLVRTEPSLDQHANQINEACRQLHQIDNFLLVGPPYDAPSFGIVGDSHYRGEGQNRRGQTAARAMLTGFFGSGWNPCRLHRTFWVDAVTIRLEVEAQLYPLVADRSGAIVSTETYQENLGFFAAELDGTDLPLRARLMDDRHIDLVLTRPPTGRTICLLYGDRMRSSGVYGSVGGAAGLIHDSVAHLNLYTGVKHPNWMTSFSILVPV